jgi:C4-dicarboxylate transporter, DctM subunit
MEGFGLIILIFAVLLIVLFAGIPVAFSLGLVAFAGLIAVLGLNGTLGAVGVVIFGSLKEFSFVALPLFILMAQVLAVTGIGAELFDTIGKWFNRVPGALAVSAVVASMGFGAVCGSGAGTLATIGSVSLPEMKKRNYHTSLLLGPVTASGALGQIIPPSLPLVLYGVLAEESIGRLFIAGILPGIILGVIFMIYIVFVCIRNPKLAPALPGVTWKERILSLGKTWSIIVLIIVVLGSIYAGVCTATESAGIGAVFCFIIAAIYKKLNWKVLRQIMEGTVRLSSFIFMLIIAALTLSYLVSNLGVDRVINEFMSGVGSQWIAMAIIIVIFLILGCFIDMASITLLTLPVLLPTINTMGWDLAWFGMIMLICLCIGTITPPFGTHLFITKALTDIHPEIYSKFSVGNVMRATAPYLWLTFVGLILVVVFPQISLWLPSTMMQPITFK